MFVLQTAANFVRSGSLTSRHRLIEVKKVRVNYLCCGLNEDVLPAASAPLSILSYWFASLCFSFVFVFVCVCQSRPRQALNQSPRKSDRGIAMDAGDHELLESPASWGSK